MNKFTFELLTPYDFENLARDIVQTREKINLEAFADGKDGGVDFRRIYDRDNNLVIQAKHSRDYESTLKLLKKEVEKVQRLKPSRYIIVISANLTPPQKDHIKELFSPYVLDTSDIITRKDIEDLVERHVEVLKRNQKLWFTSASVLELIQGKRVFGRTAFLVSELKNKSRLFVETDNVNQAIDTLKDNKVAIISGNPGVGKTTLAQILILKYLEEDYDIHAVTSVDELEDAVNAEGKVFIYYDDFLGRSLITETTQKNEDQRLIDIIRRIQSGKIANKRLVITTREYILKQAKHKFESFAQYDLDFSKIVVDLVNYSDLQKAQILYNHIYFSDLPAEYRVNLIENKAYKQIIKHDNYNPRLIESVISLIPIKKIPSDKFIKEFLNILENPDMLWEGVFENSILDTSKIALFALCLTDDQVVRPLLEGQYNLLAKNYVLKSGSSLEALAFVKSLKELEGTFIDIIDDKGENKISFSNPSIADFVLKKARENNLLLESMLESSTSAKPVIEQFIGNDDFDIEFRKLALQQVILGWSRFRDVPATSENILRLLYSLWQNSKDIELEEKKIFLKTQLEKVIKETDDMIYMRFYPMIEYAGLLHEKFIKEDIRKIVKQTQYVEELEDVIDIAENYSDELDSVLEEEGIPLDEMLSELTHGFIQNLEDMSDSYLGELSDQLDNFESMLGIDLDYAKSEVHQEIAKRNYYEDQATEAHMDAYREGTYSTPTIDPVDEMFNSMK